MGDKQRAESVFVVDEITDGEPIASRGRTDVARARVHKTFSGDLEAKGVVELSTAVAPDGRGYVGIEWVEGTLQGRSGGFALLHAGTMDSSGQWATWPIVPGSGSGELEGIMGDGVIEIDDQGEHRFSLTYELPER